MAGAAQQLHDASIINPYDVEGFSVVIEQGIEMPRDERRRRMHAMRRVVAGRNIFGWASDILEDLERLNPRALPPVPDRVSSDRKRLSVTRKRQPVKNKSL